jgi:hypothetical protein
MRTIVIAQSNYIPWKGYFDLIHDADVFIFYDDVQYTKNDWRNRNRVKTPKGLEWLTIPVGSKINRLIYEVEIKDSSWQTKHWKTLQQNYRNCPYFSLYQSFFEDFFLDQRWLNLSEMNQFLIRQIAYEFLNIKTEYQHSRSYVLVGRKEDRLLDLLEKVKAERYISGPAARDYIDPSRFKEVGIDLVWKDYAGYPEYPQTCPPFHHEVSILDLLFNVGPSAPWYIWGWREALDRT